MRLTPANTALWGKVGCFTPETQNQDGSPLWSFSVNQDRAPDAALRQGKEQTAKRLGKKEENYPHDRHIIILTKILGCLLKIITSTASAINEASKLTGNKIKAQN